MRETLRKCNGYNMIESTQIIPNVLNQGSSRYAIDRETGNFLKKPSTQSRQYLSLKWNPLSDKYSREFGLNKSKIRSKLLAWGNTDKAKRFLAFYSISFPGGFEDNDGYKVLNTCLTRIRKLKGKFNYLWVAERQKNNTIHYHLITDEYFNIRVINYYFAAAINNIVKEKVHKFPNFTKKKYNGVDVRRVYKVADLRKYVTKYVTKNQVKFYRAAWNCSTSVSRLVTHLHLTENEFNRLLEQSCLLIQNVISSNTCDFEITVNIYGSRNGSYPDIRSEITRVNNYILKLEQLDYAPDRKAVSRSIAVD